ncbi:S8 family serine peptidase [Shewanella fodinae]|jgi:subtilisin family serine protease|uniref:S8 family serine peptidase n=1 Tax=Shewanella fodinae TaxID=552357 RepID=UPI001672BE99|nr:S8 family serine peptidase [Shewanella fodinae]MCL2906247.1 S8 family serine peptidase [Shewanella fodinae]GGZ00176.1 peptidase S8 [Shewanella fodinae]
MRKSLIALSVTAAILAGCGSDNKTPETVNTPPQSTDVAYDVAQSMDLSGQLEGSDAEGGLSFSLVDPADVKLGTLTITNPSSGAFTYRSDAMEGTEVVRFKVSDGQYESISTLTINITGGDPLYAYQWHLKNNGQNAFAANRGIAGEDINVADAIASGVKGQGVVVAVVDDGVEISHPDLAPNIVSGGSYNLITGTVDPTPFSDGAAHGTAVSGIIAAAGWNGIGGRGVAPEAKVIGFNFLDSDPTGAVSSVQTFENFAKSHGASAYSDYARVFNQSYGYNVPFPHTFDEDENEVYADIAQNSADGKGSIFVKSAGNGYNYYSWSGYYWLPGDYFDVSGNEKANLGLPFHNANMSTDNANVFNLVVSAVNAKGELSSYSSVGSNVFVTAPGGEYGDDDPAIVTTDRAGCDKGWTVTDDRPATPFAGGQHPLNLTCDYTSEMNGTSSAAPNTSGAVAMIMSANPSLSWRDVRYILASTATEIQPDIAPVEVPVGSGDSAVEYDAIPSWIKNAAGFHFHNFYGFGRVDVSAAVAAAKNYTQDLGSYIITDWQSHENLEKSIPDASVSGASDGIEIADDMVIEAVQIEVSADHLRLPDLAVELISPSGTRSVVMTPYNGMVYQGVMDPSDPTDYVPGFENTPMLSNAFYGESTKGTWTLKVIDVNSGDYSFILYPVQYVDIPNESQGVLKGWSIRFHGHKVASAS